MKESGRTSVCCGKNQAAFSDNGEHTGSVGVVTINLPRIAYQSKGEKEFFARLDQMMDLAARSLSIKRKVISTLLKNGLYPYTPVTSLILTITFHPSASSA